MAKTKKEKLRQKLTDKYRLVVLNENTFEERFSLKLSRLNVFVLGGLFSIILFTLTILFIGYTPIKEYIPGYSSTNLKLRAEKLANESKSLKDEIEVLKRYTEATRLVLTGELKAEAIDSLKADARQRVIDVSKLSATREDSLFREKIESKDRFPIQNNVNSTVEIVFFSPLSGTISQNFDPDSKHFAVDVVAKTGTAIKAIADGTVIFSGWTTETGYVILLKHSNNYTSVYKHNGNLLKQQGDFVKSGEVISSVGSSGELTTGPHLHFELWSGGYAVNPIEYIDFK